MTWAIREKIGVGFGLALLILIVISVVSYHSITRLVETARWVTHSREVLEALETVLAQMSDVETGARGYVITGAPRYLEPHHTAIVLIDQKLKELRQLTADNPYQQQRLATLESLIAGRVVLVTETIDLRQGGGFEAARQMVLTDKDKVVMDAIRNEIRAAQNEERAFWEALPPHICAIIEPHYRATLAGETKVYELPFANHVLLVRALPLRNESEEIFAGMIMSQDGSVAIFHVGRFRV